ncbi:hypothetical protein [Streptomyces spectabilis]|uniref:Uncharacterized protein n=1 Tax=Streptomyces spectabilis TaxID=68270 RepID=A0A5P2X5T4_STRST|nr:hypothetical protein [Streptomyces spectabilis]MBB5103255.1 hypothetical protein [Streptomyces spectabilis]MCI3902447.1 hypothetical protein [Streptomyces spectabilis]QEV59791.1 hypothetical protein CP982_14465 [Streptomyces spectabilis]GGV13828.1 hypothetical protein GCM10010245_24090 [Streptomyces spectabilis]
MTATFRKLAEQVVARHDDHLLDYGPDKQADRVVAALQRLNRIVDLTPAIGTDIDLAGFGKVPAQYASGNDSYFLLSDASEQLGWFHPRACKWAEKRFAWAVQEQRRIDEERGDGRLGWECLTGHVDLELHLCVDDPQAKPDAGGRRWSDSGDWLISTDRIPDLLASSPWGKEFMDNSMDAFRHAAREIFGDKLKQSPVIGPDGQPTGSNAYDLFEPQLPKDEALRRARRGPALDDEEGLS